MKRRIDYHLLEYLGFQPPGISGSAELIQSDDATWERGLAFTDTAGLTLHLLAKLEQRQDLAQLPLPLQQRLMKSLEDNSARMSAMLREWIEFNQLLQAQNIRYLSIKGLVLYPDFVDRIEHRVQYDHDFLIKPEDLQRAYQCFLRLGYSPLPTPDTLAVDHLPTLIKQTGWEWGGNLYDPEIPRGIELHFQLWGAEHELIPITSLETAWQHSTVRRFGALPVPTLSRMDLLLYCTLHSFRHLLRNDLRLSHLYEIAFFLQQSYNEEPFWKEFLGLITGCPKSLKAVATMFQLACQVFSVTPAPIARQYIDEYLSAAAELWIRTYGKAEAVHCYRRNKNAIFLHLDSVDSLLSQLVVIRRKMIPGHLPLPSFGVHTPNQARNRKFILAKRLRYAAQIFLRAGFHCLSLGVLLTQLPAWYVKLFFLMKRRRSGTEPLCEGKWKGEKIGGRNESPK
jgi:putative nucleotidyltransferase-like protein